MDYVIWAQAMAEYGVMAAVTTKVSAVYSQVEFSFRHNQGTWLFVGGGILLGVWLLRRR